MTSLGNCPYCGASGHGPDDCPRAKADRAFRPQPGPQPSGGHGSAGGWWFWPLVLGMLFLPLLWGNLSLVGQALLCLLGVVGLVFAIASPFAVRPETGADTSWLLPAASLFSGLLIIPGLMPFFGLFEWWYLFVPLGALVYAMAVRAGQSLSKR